MSDNNNNNNNNKQKKHSNYNSDKRWIVAMVDDSILVSSSSNSSSSSDNKSKRNNVIGRIIKLKDPNTGEFREYGFMENTTTTTSSIVEFQSIQNDYTSYMIGRHIIKDGTLYMLNRVDPLFFYLASQEQYLQQEQQSDTTTSTKKVSWQPFEQCLEEVSGSKILPKDIHGCITKEQLHHVCLTFRNDDVCYYKFNIDKSLKFLERKQNRLLEYLIRQDQQAQQQQKRKMEETSTNKDQSISENFHMPDDIEQEVTTTVSTPQSNKSGTSNTLITVSPETYISDTETLKIESIQIICNYLSAGWSTKFMEHMGVTKEQIYGTTSATETASNAADAATTTDPLYGNVQRVVETDKSTTASSSETTIKKSVVVESSARTAGNKRLSKCNTKGMSSISSFFGVAAANKNKKPKH
jgi:hypothetical protein